MRPALIALSLSIVIATVSGAGLAFAQQQTTTVNGFALSNDKPIQIESDKLEIREQEKKAFFTGNVKAVQGAMTLSASNMTVFYKGNSTAMSAGGGDIDKIEVSGNVSLVSGNQSARGEKGAVDMRTELLTLEGKNVVLAEGQNVFKGCKLTVQMKTGQATLGACGGRVQIMIDPKSKNSN